MALLFNGVLVQSFNKRSEIINHKSQIADYPISFLPNLCKMEVKIESKMLNNSAAQNPLTFKP